MIEVNFTADSGETTYEYSFSTCTGDKNVSFAVDSSASTWCHITSDTTNSTVKIGVDNVPATQTDSRSTNVQVYLNGNENCNTFKVTQEGQSVITCECPVITGSSFNTIEQEGTTATATTVATLQIGSQYSAYCLRHMEVEELYSNFSEQHSYSISANGTSGIINIIFEGAVSENEYEYVKSSQYVLKVPGEGGTKIGCFTGVTMQEGYIPCDCESVIGPNGMVQAICTNFDNNGTSGEYVLIASGHTFGCGSIRGDRGESEMLMEIKTEYEERHDDPSHPEIVTDVFCYFKGKIRSNPSGNDRSTSLFFIYIDRNGKEMECEQSIMLNQGQYLCQCPNVNGISGSYEIDSEGAYYFSAITSFNVGSLTTYIIDNAQYACQFILAESDQSWCVPYTSYNGTSMLSLSVSASTNDTGSNRTANITFTNIANAKNSNLDRLRTMQTYSKQYLDSQGFTYDLCGNAGVVTITQPAAAACNCETHGFAFIDDTGDTATDVYAHASEGQYCFYYILRCGTASFELVGQPDWISIVSTSTDSLCVYCSENESWSTRVANIKITINIDGQTCELNGTITQEGCNCDSILNGIGPVGTSQFTTGASAVSIIYDFDMLCGLSASDYTGITTNSAGSPVTYEWINYVSIIDTQDSNVGRIIIGLKENDTSSTRYGWIKIIVNGYDNCSRVYSVTQNGAENTCDCSHLNGYITSNSPVAFSWNDTGFKTGATVSLPCRCSTVKGMVVEGIPNWLSVQVTGDSSSKYAKIVPNSSNTSDTSRSVGLEVYLTDNNGNKVDSNCYKTITVVQDCQTCNCDCSQFVGSDSTYTHITASTDSSNRVLISKSSNDQSNPLTVGYILVPGNSLPSCLAYEATNAQSTNLVTYVEEDTSYSGGRYFLIKAYMVNSSPSASTASSTIIRIDIRSGEQCNNSQGKNIEYYFTN